MLRVPSAAIFRLDDRGAMNVVKKSSTQDRLADTGYKQQRASELPAWCSIPIHDGQDSAKRHSRLKDDEVGALCGKACCS